MLGNGSGNDNSDIKSIFSIDHWSIRPSLPSIPIHSVMLSHKSFSSCEFNTNVSPLKHFCNEKVTGLSSSSSSCWWEIVSETIIFPAICCNKSERIRTEFQSVFLSSIWVQIENPFQSRRRLVFLSPISVGSYCPLWSSSNAHPVRSWLFSTVALKWTLEISNQHLFDYNSITFEYIKLIRLLVPNCITTKLWFPLTNFGKSLCVPF